MALAQFTAPGEAVFTDADDLRHRPAPGQRMRDSLFWNLIVPEASLAMQVYVFVNHRGRSGYNVCVWGGDREPIVEQHLGQVDPEANFDDWDDAGLRLTQPDHSWGPRNWGYPDHWKWLLAHTPSGRALSGFIWIAEGEWGFNGYVLRDGRPVAIDAFTRQAAQYDDAMDHTRLDAEIRDVEGQTTTLVLESFGMVRMPHGDELATIIMEAGCWAEIDGEAGGGQFETHWPVQDLQHLAAARRA
jgi:hypothetical protein